MHKPINSELYKATSMSSGYPLSFLAFGTIGVVGFLAMKARKDVADLKGHPARSAVIQHHGEEPRQNMPGTEH